MARQQSLSGYAKTEYAIDTSSLVDIQEHPKAVALWPKIISLIQEGRLRTVSEVMDELEHVNADAYEILRRYRDKFVYRDRAALLRHGPRLINEYPSISRARYIWTAADPWVIALAIIEGMTVVCDEKSKKNRKMPDVCRKEKVNCLRLPQFLEAEKLV